MSPLTYHAIGAVVAAIMLLIGRYGPADLRGWPPGIRRPYERWIVMMLAMLFWPVVLGLYAIVLVFRLGAWVLRLQKLVGAVVDGFFLFGYGAVTLAIIWWLAMVAMPFLARWYGIA